MRSYNRRCTATSINIDERMPPRKKKNPSTRIFFTSDLWLGRNNAIDLFNRPFANVNEMDKTIIENWNTTVGDDDLVFVLGNIAYDAPKIQNTLSDLRGTKILMLSELDKMSLRVDDAYLDEITMLYEIFMASDPTKFTSEYALYDNYGCLTSEEVFNAITTITDKFHPNVIILKNSIVDIARYGITLSLYPMLEWNGKSSGTLNLHGGMTESSKDLDVDNRISVRTDFWGYRPIELEEIQTIVKQLKK